MNYHDANKKLIKLYESYKNILRNIDNLKNEFKYVDVSDLEDLLNNTKKQIKLITGTTNEKEIERYIGTYLNK